MSQENVELVRAVWEAWNRGDMDAVRELYDPDAIMRMDENWPEPGPYFGRDAVMREFEQVREAWDADTIEAISDYIDAGDRVVVRVVWRVVGRGPGSNLEFTIVYTVRKGRIFYHEHFIVHAEALKAVGLSEQDISGPIHRRSE